MAKPDGRIEKGQKLSTAISARAWNRAQDAADIVLGVRPGIEAGSLATLRLPCVKAILRDKGYFGEVRVFDEEYEYSQNFSDVTASMPAAADTLASEPELIRQAVSYAFPNTYRASASEYSRFKMESQFAICIGNDSSEFALSGLAVTRVRVFSKHHRYARLPRPVDGYQGESPDGSLDSAWWGKARIIGYAYDDSGRLEFSHREDMSTATILFRWALVAF